MPGVDSPMRLTGNESTVFFVAASIVVTAHLTSPRLLINVTPLMKNSLIKSVLTITRYWTVSFLLQHLPHRATTFDLVHIVWNYRNILAIWLTPISLHECFLLTFTKLLLLLLLFSVSIYLIIYFLSLSICSCVLSNCLINEYQWMKGGVRSLQVLQSDLHIRYVGPQDWQMFFFNTDK